MQVLKHDISKLKTINSYAKMKKCTTANIYKMIADNKIKPVLIDGVKFIQLD